MKSKPSLLVALQFLAALGINAQTLTETEARRAVTIVPRISVAETLTNNVSLTDINPLSDQITEISPGIRIEVEGTRLKGYFDYSIDEIFYAHDAKQQESQKALNAMGTLEAIEKWAFIDFSGSISRQIISAFGKQSIDNTSINDNQTEVSNYRISPYVRGRLGDTADYEARYSRVVTQTGENSASNVTTIDSDVKIASRASASKLGWLAALGQQHVSYSLVRPAEASYVILGPSYAISHQIKVYATVGRETNNYVDVEKKDYTTKGFGLNWTPSEVTKLSASVGRRSFGDVHSVSFEHRSDRTVWKFTDSRDISTTLSSNHIAGLGNNYDLLFAQFASLEPDPIARAQLVNAYLQANGVSPSGQAINGFLTTALSLQRRQDLSFALLGIRDTVIFVATRSETSLIGDLSADMGDLADSSLVRQTGFNLNYAHRLTPDHSLGILLSRQATAGSSNAQDTTLRSINVSITGKVGKQSSATVSVRRVVFSGSTEPYAETALTGNLNVRF